MLEEYTLIILQLFQQPVSLECDVYFEDSWPEINGVYIWDQIGQFLQDQEGHFFMKKKYIYIQ